MQVRLYNQNDNVNFKMRLRLDASVPKEVFDMKSGLDLRIADMEPKIEATLFQENYHGCLRYVLVYLEKAVDSFKCMSKEEMAQSLSKKFTRKELKAIKRNNVLAKSSHRKR